MPHCEEKGKQSLLVDSHQNPIRGDCGEAAGRQKLNRHVKADLKRSQSVFHVQPETGSDRALTPSPFCLYNEVCKVPRKQSNSSLFKSNETGASVPQFVSPSHANTARTSQGK